MKLTPERIPEYVLMVGLLVLTFALIIQTPNPVY